MTRKLTLHVKKIYFDQIDSGDKLHEFREQTKYWKKRLVGREYDEVVICLGYPPKDDTTRRIRFTYRGYLERTIQHEHFNGEANVFAIIVTQANRISGGRK